MENLGELLFNYLTEDYKDKVDSNKDLRDYLSECTKNDLLGLYLLYGYAANNDYVIEDIVSFRKEKKEFIIDRIMDYLDVNFLSIIQFFNEKRMDDIFGMSGEQEIFSFSIKTNNYYSIDTIKILKQLKLVFCKKEKNGIIIHMPRYIREKIQKLTGNTYLEYYDDIISYVIGILDTYGAIFIKDAYDIIKKDIAVQYERFESIVKFVSILELDMINFSYEYNCLFNVNLSKKDIELLLKKNVDKKVIYDKLFYKNMNNGSYLENLNEFKELKNYLEKLYDFDINDDEDLKCYIIKAYVDYAQVDSHRAKEYINSALERYFEIDDIEKNIMIGYIEKIRSKMPIWMQGGKINIEMADKKVGRNELCPCDSGLKYKKCHR